MRQWKSLAALQAAAPSCFPHPPSPSPCPSPPRDHHERHLDLAELDCAAERSLSPPPPLRHPGQQKEEVVRLVGCDGRVRSYRPPVTARELMQAHPCHLVCRADALLIGEKIPAVAPAEELQPGQAYFLLPAHLFRSVLSFVSLASSLLLLLSTATAGSGNKAGGGGGGKGGRNKRPFELCRTASGTLQIKFSDDFLVGGAEEEKDKEEGKARAAVLRGDERLEKEYEELVEYSKSRRWSPTLEPIQETVAPTTIAAADASSPSPSPTSAERRKGRGIPFLGRLGSRRRRDSSSSSSSAAMSCNGGSAVACSG